MAFWDRPERVETADGVLSADNDFQPGCMKDDVIDIIEKAKENIQPLRRGRDAHALAAQCELQPSRAKHDNEMKRRCGQCLRACLPCPATFSAYSAARPYFCSTREYEIEIAGDDLPDPLEPWVRLHIPPRLHAACQLHTNPPFRYLRWCGSSLGACSHADLIQTMDRCLKKFSPEERYKDDERFVDIWLSYVQFPNQSTNARLRFSSHDVRPRVRTSAQTEHRAP
jgi:hypothetical protein